MNDPAVPNPTFGVLILAGGRSSRMGADKASLPYRGVTLLSHMRTLAAQSGAASVLVGGGALAELKDPVAGAGPVASLCALAEYALPETVPSRWVVLPVDMPMLEPTLIRRLAAAPARAAAFTGHPLPLALTLDAETRAAFARVKIRLLAQDSVAVRQVLGLLGGQDLGASDSETAQLINVNTPDEWSRLNDRLPSPRPSPASGKGRAPAKPGG
ncbi:MAG: molybdenum cofactor guanylyltransferase [Rhodospirillaceae bacterium]